MATDWGNFMRDPAETAAIQNKDYLELIRKIQSGDMTPTSEMGLRPWEFVPKGAVTPFQEGMDPVQWLDQNFHTPSHGSDFLSNAPLIGAGAFLGGAAFGGFDPFSAGGATSAGADALLSAPTDELIAQAFADTPYAAGAGASSGGPAAINGGIGGAGTGAMAGAAGSLIPGIPNNVAAGVGQGILGYLGAGKISDAFSNVSNQNLAIGAPFRNKLEQSYSPGFSLFDQPGYGDALQRAGDVSARAANVQYGNPYDAAAQANIQKNVFSDTYLPALANYRGQLGQFGGLGLNTAGMAQLGGAAQAGGGLDALGYGLGTIFNPQPNLNDILRQLQQSGQQPGLSLNIGGNLFGRNS